MNIKLTFLIGRWCACIFSMMLIFTCVWFFDNARSMLNNLLSIVMFFFHSQTQIYFNLFPGWRDGNDNHTWNNEIVTEIPNIIIRWIFSHQQLFRMNENKIMSTCWFLHQMKAIQWVFDANFNLQFFCIVEKPTQIQSTALTLSHIPHQSNQTTFLLLELKNAMNIYLLCLI